MTPQIAPEARRARISSIVQPASDSTSSVCSPSLGSTDEGALVRPGHLRHGTRAHRFAIDLGHHPSMPNLRVGEGLTHGVHRRHARVQRPEAFDPFVPGGAGEDRAEAGGDVGLPIERFELPDDQIRHAQGRAQRLPELGLEGADRQVSTVRRFVDPIAGEPLPKGRDAGGRFDPGRQERAEVDREPGHDAVEHRHVHEPTATRCPRLDQRREHADRAEHAATAQVADLHARRHRSTTVARSGHRQCAAEAEIVEVVARPVPVRAVLPVARDRHVHEPRVDR